MRKKDGAIKSNGEGSTAALLTRYFHGREYKVYKDYALNQAVEVDRNELSEQEFDFYTRASLDFVVCHKDARQSFELAIEYDGAYHAEPKQAWRDQIKNRICGLSDLPLLRIGQDAVNLRRDVTILEFILDQYFGEKAFTVLREAGKLDWEDEYFAQFPATTAVQKRLMQRGLFPPVFVLNSKDRFFWYQVSHPSLETPEPSCGEPRSWQATVRVSIFEGPTTDREVFHVTRCVSICDPNPSHNVVGVHGWHIVSELATYLCFDYIEREWLPGDPGL